MILLLKDVMSMMKLSIINNNIEEQVGIESNKNPVGYFKRKQKNPQAHGYRCSFHPGVFQSIDFPQGT